MFRQLLRTNFQLVGRTGLRCFSSAAEEGSIDHIQSLVAGKKVVVFMKGTPESPRCGFSNAVVQVLKLHGVDRYDSYDVLSNEKIRQGVKDFSSWPTIPQVFINGEFIGGCDIVIEMHQNGELVEELKKINVKSSLDQPPNSA